MKTTTKYYENIHLNYTLHELIILISFLLLFSVLFFPLTGKTSNETAQTLCENNLKQIGQALVAYRGDNDEAMSPWISTLYSKYTDNKKLYHCPVDGNKPETQIEKWLSKKDGKFQKAYDRKGNKGIYGTNPNWKNVNKISYFYEFSEAHCSGILKKMSWSKYKNLQLKGEKNINKSNKSIPFAIQKFSPSILPMLRCSWHQKSLREGFPYYNISYDGNFYISKAHWESDTHININK